MSADTEDFIKDTIKGILVEKYDNVLIKRIYSQDSTPDSVKIIHKRIEEYDKNWVLETLAEDEREKFSTGKLALKDSALVSYITRFIDSEILAKPLTYLAYVQELYSGDEVEYDPMNKGDDSNSYSGQLHQFGDDTLNTYVMQIAVYGYSHVRFIWSPGHEIENYLPKLIALSNTTEGRRYERRDGVLRGILDVKYLFDLDNPADSAELLELFKTLFKNDLLKC